MKRSTSMLWIVVLLSMGISTAAAQWSLSGLSGKYPSRFLIASSRLWVCCNQGGGGIWYTTNEGTSWTQSMSGTNVLYLAAASGGALFAATGTDGIYRSTDNGASWQQNAYSGKSSSLVFVAPDGSGGELIFCDTEDGLFVSTNTGDSWSATTITAGSFMDACIVGNDIYLAHYGSLTVYRSTDHGASWESRSSGMETSYLYSILRSGSEFYVGRYNGGIYKSTNDGASWSATGRTSGDPKGLAAYSGVLFASFSNGPGVLRSVDYGATWTAINEGLSAPYMEGIIVSGSYVFAAKAGDGVWKRPLSEALPVQVTSFTAALQEGGVCLRWRTATETENYGFEIQRRPLGAAAAWETIGFVPGCGTSQTEQTYTWQDPAPLPGRSAYRLKQIDRDGASSYIGNAEIVSEALPRSLALEQNYPNPFNPSTTIGYALPEKGHVQIIICDQLGRTVATLVDGMREAGRYSAVWNGHDAQNRPAASGMYFSVLRSGGTTLVKRVMLLR